MLNVSPFFVWILYLMVSDGIRRLFLISTSCQDHRFAEFEPLLLPGKLPTSLREPSFTPPAHGFYYKQEGIRLKGNRLVIKRGVHCLSRIANFESGSTSGPKFKIRGPKFPLPLGEVGAAKRRVRASDGQRDTDLFTVCRTVGQVVAVGINLNFRHIFELTLNHSFR
jgi:hypothetical protein